VSSLKVRGGLPVTYGYTSLIPATSCHSKTFSAELLYHISLKYVQYFRYTGQSDGWKIPSRYMFSSSDSCTEL